jgi:STE24 endopeptidase
MRRVFIGVATGFAVAYGATRLIEAIRDLRAAAPATFAPDPVRYGRTRRTLMLAGIARSVASLGALAFGIAAPLAARLRTGSPDLDVAAFVGVTLLGSSLADLPTEYVEGYVLERGYGMSKQSARDWLIDRAKATGVSLAVTLPLTVGFAALVRRFPRRWPLLASAASAPLLILANLIAPTYIAPLFNRFEPLRGPLEERLRALASRYGVGDAEILRIDMSRQTEKANAYVTGIFGTHRIVVGDTLLGSFRDDEIGFVVAHELGHYVNHDVWRAIAIGTAAASFVIAGAGRLARRGLPDESSLGRPVGLARLLFFGTLLSVAVGPLIAAFSRSVEWSADRFALAATSDPQAGVDAFTRLRERNLAEEEQPRWMELLFASHPSLRARIDALRAALTR